MRRGTPPRAPSAIAAAFGLSALASIALVVVYALGGQPQIEGSLIAVAAGGLAIGFVLWGKHLMPKGPFVEEREPMEAAPAEHRRMETAFARSPREMPRRRFLARMLLGALAALGAALALPIRSLGPSPGRTLFETPWRRGVRVVTAAGRAVRVDDLIVGGVLTVFPEGHTDAADAATLLIRVDQDRFRALPGRETWSPEGNLAYSKICTHAGCPVGLYEQETDVLFCPCHQSAFDVFDGARPTQGPATRALPQLPLEVDEQGFLRAAGDFPEPAGPGFWEMES